MNDKFQLLVKSALSVCSWYSFRPVHGLIFLFKWKADDEPQGTIVHDTRRQSIFFAKQVSAISGNILK